jgi:hypothetical protein
MVATARRELARVIGDWAWAQWARPACPSGRHRDGDGLAGCRPTRPDQAADRIRQALAGVITAAQ